MTKLNNNNNSIIFRKSSFRKIHLPKITHSAFCKVHLLPFTRIGGVLWNFRSLTLTHFFNYSYAVCINSTIVVCLSSVCSSVCLSVMDVLWISVGS